MAVSTQSNQVRGIIIGVVAIYMIYVQLATMSWGKRAFFAMIFFEN